MDVCVNTEKKLTKNKQTNENEKKIARTERDMNRSNVKSYRLKYRNYTRTCQSNVSKFA